MHFYAATILITVLAPVFAVVHMVAIKDFHFLPQEVDIALGDTVTWTNNDAVTHTVTADDHTLFDSGNLLTGESFSHTFTTVASVPYYCTIHPYMTGTVMAT